MAKVTRIKASDPGKNEKNDSSLVKGPAEKAVKTKISAKGTKANKATKAAKTAKATKTSAKAAAKSSAKSVENNTKSAKKPFILIRPFVYFGRYVRDSWREIRQVRWPSRKATWKLFLAILVYTLIFVAVIMLLDALFTWLFNTVIR